MCRRRRRTGTGARPAAWSVMAISRTDSHCALRSHALTLACGQPSCVWVQCLRIFRRKQRLCACVCVSQTSLFGTSVLQLRLGKAFGEQWTDAIFCSPIFKFNGEFIRYYNNVPTTKLVPCPSMVFTLNIVLKFLRIYVVRLFMKGVSCRDTSLSFSNAYSVYCLMFLKKWFYKYISKIGAISNLEFTAHRPYFFL